MEFNYEVVGHLEGLLEAWCGYTQDLSWHKNLDLLDDCQKARIRQLRDLLHNNWLIVELTIEHSPYRDMLVKIAKL